MVFRAGMWAKVGIVESDWIGYSDQFCDHRQITLHSLTFVSVYSTVKRKKLVIFKASPGSNILEFPIVDSNWHTYSGPVILLVPFTSVIYLSSHLCRFQYSHQS